MENIENKYPALLIIGNGFDLNLGFKTSYNEFLKSSEFRSVLAREEKNYLFEYLKIKHQLNRWVDVEKELGNYCTQILYKGIKRDDDRSLENLKQEYNELCYCLQQYISRECGRAFPINEKCAGIRLLKCLYRKWNEPLEVVTFNYSDTIERLTNFNLSGIRANVFHTHGEADLHKGIVFGVEDSIDLKKEHQFLYKSHSKSKNSHGFYNRLMNTDNIIFFGYSLGETDHSYFLDFFDELTKPHKEKKRLVFYYYGEDARDDIIWQLRQITKGRYTQLEMYNEIKFINSQNYECPF